MSERVPFILELEDFARIDLSRTKAYLSSSSGFLRNKPKLVAEIAYKKPEGCGIVEKSLKSELKPGERRTFDIDYNGLKLLYLEDRTILGFSEEYVFDVDPEIVKRAEQKRFLLGRKEVSEGLKIELKLSKAKIIDPKAYGEYAIFKVEAPELEVKARVKLDSKLSRLTRPEKKISFGRLEIEYEGPEELKEETLQKLSEYYIGQGGEIRFGEKIYVEPRFSGMFVDGRILHIVLRRSYKISIERRLATFSILPLVAPEDIRIEAMSIVSEAESSSRPLTPQAALIVATRDILEDAFSKEFLGEIYKTLRDKLELVLDRLRGKLRASSEYIKRYFYFILAIYLLRRVNFESLESFLRSIYNAFRNIPIGSESDYIDNDSIHEILELSPEEAKSLAKAFAEAIEVYYNERPNSLLKDLIEAVKDNIEPSEDLRKRLEEGFLLFFSLFSSYNPLELVLEIENVRAAASVLGMLEVISSRIYDKLEDFYNALYSALKTIVIEHLEKIKRSPNIGRGPEKEISMLIEQIRRDEKPSVPLEYFVGMEELKEEISALAEGIAKILELKKQKNLDNIVPILEKARDIIRRIDKSTADYRRFLTPL